MAITVKQIAERLNISFQLVSAVLNNKNYCRASKEKRKLILETAAALGYRPNVNARILAGKPSRVLGVLADLQAASPAANVLAALEKEAVKYGFRLMIGGFHDRPEDIISSYRLLMQHKVDGVFLMSLDDLEYQQQLTEFFEKEANLVIIRAPFMPEHPGVYADLITAYADLVQVLQDSGRKNIHYLGNFAPARYQAVSDRITGLTGKFSDPEKHLHNLILCDGRETIDGNMTPDDFIRQVIKAEKIDALIFHNDITALQWLNRLHAHGLKIPEDVAVIGCNNEEFAQYTQPELSSFTFNEELIAQQAIKLMLQTLAGEKTESVSITPSLIRRGSF